MRADDNVQELVELVIKASKLGGEQVKKTLDWFMENKRHKEKFKVTVGKTNIETLNLTENSVKFLPNELDKEMMKLYSKVFKKYNVHFAVEKVGEETYKLAFAGRNMETVEHAMKKVVEEIQQQQKNKNKGLNKLNDLSLKVEENDKNTQLDKDKTRNKQRQR